MWRRKKVRWFWNNRVSGHFTHSVFYHPLPPLSFFKCFDTDLLAFCSIRETIRILTDNNNFNDTDNNNFNDSMVFEKHCTFSCLQVLMNFRINEFDQMLYTECVSLFGNFFCVQFSSSYFCLLLFFFLLDDNFLSFEFFL